MLLVRRRTTSAEMPSDAHGKFPPVRGGEMEAAIATNRGRTCADLFYQPAFTAKRNNLPRRSPTKSVPESFKIIMPTSIKAEEKTV